MPVNMVSNENPQAFLQKNIFFVFAGGCDFDTTLCLGDVGTGDISWRREVGLLDRRSDDLINTQSMPGEGPMFDHTQPLSTKGMCRDIKIVQ